jgi:hypothetical protein
MIGCICHLTILTKVRLGDNRLFLGMMRLKSWGIEHVAETTKSIIASACFHMIIPNRIFKDGIHGTEKMTILGVPLLFGL